jgi:hypothetical protein
MSLPTPPKGSLEDLFRHHLLESEAAAVPPRPHVWEQLDNSLLLAQNEKYRRRLLVHRWAVAASLLLAMLAGGGWWQSQRQPAAPTLAQATSTGTEALGGAGRSAASPSYASTATNHTPAGYPATGAGASATSPAAPTAGSISSSNGLAIDQTATFSTASVASLTNKKLATAHHRSQLAALASVASFQASASLGLSTAPRAGSDLAASYERRAANNSGLGSLGDFTDAITTTPEAGSQLALAATEPASFTTAGLGEEALATRPAQLALAATSLPSSLGALPQPQLPVPAVERRWKLGLAYAASSFQPNIDFAKSADSYNKALGATSAFVTQSAAAEYRSNLRAGLGQRLSMWATRRLGTGRFGLRTGLELAQNTAYSASTVAFVGEQVADVNYLSYTNAYIVARPAQLRTSSYRYRTASVPVEVQYNSSPLKTGFSFYGRLGGLVTALLNVRSEVDESPEATRTYSLMSAGSPYRHLSANIRGGAGIHFQPLNHQWGLSLGPVAEAGILSLNADPIQDFWSQKRPYSFGLEAGVELGRAPRVP